MGYKRTNIKGAFNHLMKGGFLLIAPTKAYISGPYAVTITVNQNSLDKFSGYTQLEKFENMLNHIRYYNCNDELGNGLKLFKKIN